MNFLVVSYCPLGRRYPIQEVPEPLPRAQGHQWISIPDHLGPTLESALIRFPRTIRTAASGLSRSFPAGME